jgi:DNA-binding MarR family transcriptional regulator
VDRAAHPDDARVVRVVLTPQGEQVLGELSALHRDELSRMRGVLAPPLWQEPG